MVIARIKGRRRRGPLVVTKQPAPAPTIVKRSAPAPAPTIVKRPAKRPRKRKKPSAAAAPSRKRKKAKAPVPAPPKSCDFPPTINRFSEDRTQELQQWFERQRALLQKAVAKEDESIAAAQTVVQRKHAQGRKTEAMARFKAARRIHRGKKERLLWFQSLAENGIDEEDRADVLGKVQRELNPRPTAPLEIDIYRFDRCTKCGEAYIVVEEERALLCFRCGVRVETLDTSGQSTSTSYSNMDRKVTLFSCKRMNKAREVLKQISARQKSVVPFTIVLDITRNLHEHQGVMNSHDVQFKHVQEALRSMDLTNFNIYCAQIYAKIKGCSSIRLTPRMELVIMAMFASIQDPWNRLKPHASSSFLNVRLVVLLFCKFLGYDQILPYLYLSKTRVSIDAQIALMQRIFEDRGWAPFPVLNEEERHIVGLLR